jgi:hypothetical protein
MYDIDIINNRIIEAESIVKEKKQKYNKLMKIIECFISENDIIVKEAKEYFFELFTNDMYNLPLKLTNLLYDTDSQLAKYVMLDIKIYKYNSRILIDGITFVNFTYINPEIRKNILEYKCNGIYSNVIYKCFGPELLLITIYSDLINPNLCENWDYIYNKELNLSNDMINIKNKIGSGYNNNSIINQLYNHLKLSSVKKSDNIDINTYIVDNNNINDNIINKFKNILINYYKNEDYIFIGQIAINLYINTNEKITIEKKRIQIISQNDINYEINKIKSLIGNTFKYSINNLKIPTNLNLHKLSIYYNNKHLIDIFDAGNYELISYNILNNVKVGTPFVILRFILINIWTLMYYINTNDSSDMTHIYKLLDEYIYMRRYTNNLDINMIFSTSYIGQYEDILLTKLRVANKLKTKFIPSYYPLLKKFESNI